MPRDLTFNKPKVIVNKPEDNSDGERVDNNSLESQDQKQSSFYQYSNNLNNPFQTAYDERYESNSNVSNDSYSLYFNQPYSSQSNNSAYSKYQPQSPTDVNYSQNSPFLNYSSQLNTHSVPNSPTVAQSYDRYPKSFFNNLSEQNSKVSLIDNHSTSNSSDQPLNSKPPSWINEDFSPFGGYPTSSFPLSIDEKEADDYLHNPDPILDAKYEKNRFWNDLKHMDKTSLGGLIGFLFLLIGSLIVFILYPVLTFTSTTPFRPQVYEILTDYQYPMLSAIRQDLVDPDTPQSALYKQVRNGETWKLVFSDEFNIQGRTFYDGDDQFFTAPDFHYAATNDLEWYDPDAVSTENGTLTLTLDAFQNHDLFYRSGMLQSWNKMCFTQGKLEFSARLPGYGSISGLWPGMWSMGNLARPGYLGSTEGLWPYSYDSCDAGITPNQSSPDGISYLPGQRLNKCTCPGESHPNPGVGRGAVEIDVLEGEIMTDPLGVRSNGVASQSLQVAPYDIWYIPDYDFIEIYNKSVTTMNTYTGGPFQQAISGITTLNRTWYEAGETTANFQTYGYEYLNDDDNGYLTWYVGESPTYTMYADALHPNGNIGWRQLPKEPISIIMNLGISNNWAYINWPALMFPSQMRIDYVRVYQPEDQINMSCDPEDYPTYDYIQQHLNLYYNDNLTTFEDGGYTFPKNRLTGC